MFRALQLRNTPHSAQAPAFAALVSLLNEARLQAKMPAMGFLNPFLYTNAHAFFDVVEGTNAIDRGGGGIKYGFDCTKGWDPATGVGTPHFGKLLAAAVGTVLTAASRATRAMMSRAPGSAGSWRGAPDRAALTAAVPG